MFLRFLYKNHIFYNNLIPTKNKFLNFSNFLGLFLKNNAFIILLEL